MNWHGVTIRAMKRPSFWIACLSCLAVATVLLLRVHAEPSEGRPRFDGDTIVLPVVIAGDTNYRMELQRKTQRSRAQDAESEGQTLEGTEFRVMQSLKIAETREGAPAVLKHNALRIPVVQWGAHDYRMELRGDGQQFKVTS